MLLKEVAINLLKSFLALLNLRPILLWGQLDLTDV